MQGPDSLITIKALVVLHIKFAKLGPGYLEMDLFGGCSTKVCKECSGRDSYLREKHAEVRMMLWICIGFPGFLCLLLPA